MYSLSSSIRVTALAVKVADTIITIKFTIGEKFFTTKPRRINANTAKIAIDFLLNL